MAPLNSNTHLSPAELSYLHTSLSSDPPIRPDARLATDFRPFSAETCVLPNTMGSAHVGFADGREAVVGIRAEVEKTPNTTTTMSNDEQDVDMPDTNPVKPPRNGSGKSAWITLSLTLPGLRDDDKDLVFLEEMLRETLVAPATGVTGSLLDALVINTRWHWRLYIDVVLISTPESSSGSYPLPLLSMAIHLALRDTRIPRLKSEGEEDPLADDDWEASAYIYTRPNRKTHLEALTPPATLLVMVVGQNVLFDPSSTELAVADGVLAVSICADPKDGTPNLLAVRTLETSARDTMKGVPRTETAAPWDTVPGVWKPKVGGVKREVMSNAIKAALGDVGKDILTGLNQFVTQAG